MALRDVFLFITILVGLGFTLRWPFVGVLLWAWFAIMSPNQLGWTFATLVPFNLIIAIVTIASFALSRKKQLGTFDATYAVVVAFLAWMTFNSFFAISPGYSWPLWNRCWKIFALGFVVSATATSQVRVHALIWAVVLSLFYFGVKGGAFTLLTGGGFHVVGPPDSQISDNNTLALALLMSLPLANYLRTQSGNKWARHGLALGMFLSFVSILGSYSRGAFVGLGALAVTWWLRSKRKFASLIAAAVIAIPVFAFMPQTFYDRMSTIQTAQKDESFRGRQLAWQVAYDYARDHFPFGAGYSALEQDGIFQQYFPNEPGHAAHSIYFQVLGDHGFIGFALYLAILFLAFRNTFRIARAARRDPQLEWIRNLSHMIQLTLIVFCTAGAALSMAYYDVFNICVMLLPCLYSLCEDSVSKLAKARMLLRTQLAESI
jgi:probable O-glycosylation ligase (exosortase A-associated)